MRTSAVWVVTVAAVSLAAAEDLDDGGADNIAQERRYTFALEHDVTGTGTQFKKRNEVSYEGSMDLLSGKSGGRPTLRVSKFSFSPEELASVEVSLSLSSRAFPLRDTMLV